MTDQQCLIMTLSKKDATKPNKPLRVEFSFQTDIGRFTISVDDSLEGLLELLPVQIQNAGAIYDLMHCFMEMEARP